MNYTTRLFTQINKRGFSSTCNATCNYKCNSTCNATPFMTLFTFCIFSISMKHYISRELLYSERQNEEIIKRLKKLEERMSEGNNK